MPGLWEKIEGLHCGELVACEQKLAEVTHLSGWITGDVDDFFGAKGEQLLEEFLVAAFARGINDDGGFFSRKGDVVKNSFRTGGEEGGVVDLVELGITAGPVCCGLANLDSGYLFELVREAQGEEA